jgi:hypothetical protein
MGGTCDPHGEDVLVETREGKRITYLLHGVEQYLES